MVDDAQAASLAAAREALERGEYGKVLTLLEPIAEAHGPRTPLGAGVRLLLATALMGQGESERAAECCRAVQNCLDPGLRARARELLTVLEAPALNRPRGWSLTLPDLTSDSPLERLGPGAGGRRRPTPPPPPPPPVGPTRAPLGFAALAGVLLVLLLLAALLGGCVQVRSDLRFEGPGRLQLSHEFRSATGPISPWQRTLEGELARRGFRLEQGDGGSRLRTPVLPAPQALDAWVKSISAAGELAGLALPPPQAELRERNWLLGVEQRLRLEVDLTDLEPMAGLRLELGLAPLRPRAVRIASPRPAVAEGEGLRWPLAPGGANRLEVRCWRWSALGIGGLAITLALGLVLLLQRMRLALGYGPPQLPAGVTTAGDPGRS
jgi:hypothetical protein